MKKLNKLARNINELILENESVKEYLFLKKEIENDKHLQEVKEKLDLLRKEICKDKSKDSEEYFNLLQGYKEDEKIKRCEQLYLEIKDLMMNISDILSLK